MMVSLSSGSGASWRQYTSPAPYSTPAVPHHGPPRLRPIRDGTECPPAMGNLTRVFAAGARQSGSSRGTRRRPGRVGALPATARRRPGNGARALPADRIDQGGTEPAGDEEEKPWHWWLTSTV